jgi:hypothetical protein
VQNARFFRSRGLNTLYMVGEVVNTGASPASSPLAKIVLYDASKTAIDESICLVPGVRVLPASARVPCYGIFSKVTEFDKYKVDAKAYPLYSKHQVAQIELSDAQSVAPARTYQPYKVTGKATNKSAFTAKSVWVTVGLYDKENKITGAGHHLVVGNSIDPGASASFEVSIYNVASEPVRFEALAFGYDK